MNFKEFFKECIEKEVFKNLSIYIVSSWVLIQVFSETWEPFGLPKISMTYLLLALLIGFPFYIFLLWKYSLKPKESKLNGNDGLKDNSKSSVNREHVKRLKKSKIHLPRIHFYSPFQKMFFTSLLIISLMVIFSASVIIKVNFINGENMSVFTFVEEPDNNRIAVLPFENNTSNTDLDVIGKMAVDWIMHGITQNKVGEVISPQIVEDYNNALKASFIPKGDNEVLKEYLKPSKVIAGTYYLSNGRLLLQCSILDGNMNKTLISFEVTECDSDSPLDCIEDIKQRVLGYLLSKEKAVIKIEETPPKFKAYKLWLQSDALSRMQSPEQLNYINEAIIADSSFFKPKLDRVAYYYNRDQFAIADSLLQMLKEETGTKKEQLNMINHYEACFRGDNRMAYKTYREEYRIAPTDLEISMSYMVLALQFVNRPQDVDSIYLATDMRDFDLDICVSCEYRYFVKGMANLEMGLVKESIELLAPYARTIGHEYIKEVLMEAYVQNRDDRAVNELLEHIRLLGRIEYWEMMMLKTGLEYIKIGNDIVAHRYFDGVLAYFNEKTEALTKGEKELHAEIIFYKKNYPKAQELFEQLLLYDNKKISNMAYLAMSYYKNGKEEKAKNILYKLNELRTKYQFGDVDYALAQYYAFSREKDKSMDHLLKAVAAGKRFTSSTFQNDLLFNPYRESEAFQKVEKFWHD
jgi:TolB-like protein